jgi:hypothetical protein
MTEALFYVVTGLAQLAFFAGGVYFLIRQTKRDVGDLRKDVNGIGQRVRRDARDHLMLQLLLHDAREDRETIARLLSGYSRSD